MANDIWTQVVGAKINAFRIRGLTQARLEGSGAVLRPGNAGMMDRRSDRLVSSLVDVDVDEYQ
jgi:hypothetical protein